MKLLILLALIGICSCLPSLQKVYGTWYCGDDQCLWATEPNLSNAAWIVNRGDGHPTFNIIIFAFIDPVKLLNGEIPKGFTTNAVNHFKSKNMYVSFSIGGESFATNWDTALRQDAAKLAQNAAKIAKQYGVGIEIDYETDGSGSLTQMATFVKTYRSIIPIDNSASPAPESLLTIDLGAGTGYLSAISAAAGGWLTSNLLNWANAMVTGDPNGDNTQYWQQHLTGAGWANIPPMDPKYLVGCLYASSGATACKSYSGNLPTGVQWIQSKSARGLSFWSSGCPAPNACAQNCTGIQQGSKNFLG